jgi:hypothetical protein
MAYQVQVFDLEGHKTADLGRFGNIASTRQAMLNHSNTINLPDHRDSFGPFANLSEGWFIGCTEYHIRQVGAAS